MAGGYRAVAAAAIRAVRRLLQVEERRFGEQELRMEKERRSLE
jgi:hypothetical protein